MNKQHFRYGALALCGLLTLASVNWQIWQKERLISDGTTVLLQLAPRDPRSLIQGDFMRLRYRLAGNLEASAQRPRSSGEIVVRLDEHAVAHFLRLYQGEDLSEGEHRLDYRWRAGGVRLAADSYFFQEGQHAHFASARYGELRVSEEGEAVLVGLRDETFQAL